MSFWMVGKVEAPPKANRIVPNAKKSSFNPCVSCLAGVVKWTPSMIICASMHKHANNVVTRAPIPIHLMFDREYFDAI